MVVKLIDPSADERWDAFVEDHPQGCIFHHSAWKTVIDNSFPQVEPYYFILENTDGIQGGAPFFFVKSWITGKRLVSLPFTFYSDPLVGSNDFLSKLLKGIMLKQKELKATFIQFRTRYAEPSRWGLDLQEYPGFKNHTLYLEPDLDTLKRSFHRTCVRQRINRAENSNILVVEASSETDMKTFYRLHCLTRKKYGISPQPYSFFKNMWDILYPKGMLYLFIAEYDGQPVSSLLCLKYKKTVHAEYMGTDSRFNRYSGNIYLFWHAIQKAKAEGYQSFEFGSSPTSETELIDFKRRWGTVEEDISYYYLPKVEGFSAGFGSSKRYSLLSAINRRLPDPCFEWMGKMMYRHLGG